MARGVWERIPGSGIWWIHYVDAEGKRRREKVGAKVTPFAFTISEKQTRLLDEN